MFVCVFRQLGGESLIILSVIYIAYLSFKASIILGEFCLDLPWIWTFIFPVIKEFSQFVSWAFYLQVFFFFM